MDLGVGVVDRWVACALSGVGPWALEKTLVGGAYRNAQWARSIYRHNRKVLEIGTTGGTT